MIRRSTSLMLAGLLCAAPALAGDDCAVPMTDWQPRDAVIRLATGLGWDLRRIRIDDGCYEVTGRDDRGRFFEAKLDPATLKVVRMEIEGHAADAADHDDHE